MKEIRGSAAAAAGPTHLPTDTNSPHPARSHIDLPDRKSTPAVMSAARRAMLAGPVLSVRSNSPPESPTPRLSATRTTNPRRANAVRTNVVNAARDSRGPMHELPRRDEVACFAADRVSRPAAFRRRYDIRRFPGRTPYGRGRLARRQAVAPARTPSQWPFCESCAPLAASGRTPRPQYQRLRNATTESLERAARAALR